MSAAHDLDELRVTRQDFWYVIVFALGMLVGAWLKNLL